MRYVTVAMIVISGLLSAQVKMAGPAKIAGSTKQTFGSAPPSFTVNTAAHQFTCGATTCTVTMTCTAGHSYVFEAHTINAVFPTSVSACGTIVPIASCSSGVANSLFSSCGWIVSASSGSNPVVTFNSAVGNSPSPSTINVRDVTANNGTPYLDFAHSTVKSGTTSVTGETPVLTGTAEYITQSNNTDYQITTAVGAPYGNGVFDASNGPGWGDQNGTSTTPAPWTISSGSGNANTSIVALGNGGGSSCDDILFLDFEGIGSGTAPSASNLNTASKGLATSGTNQGWSLTGTSTGLSIQTGASMGPLLTPVRPCGNGNSQTGSGTVGFQNDLSTSTTNMIQFAYIGSSTKATAAVRFKTSFSGDTNAKDMMVISMSGGGGVGIQNINNTFLLECFGGTSTGPTIANISANTEYDIQWQIDTAVGGQGSVYDTSGTLVGTTTCAAGGWTATTPTALKLGRFGGITSALTGTFFYDDVRLNPAGVFPLTR